MSCSPKIPKAQHQEIIKPTKNYAINLNNSQSQTTQKETKLFHDRIVRNIASQAQRHSKRPWLTRMNGNKLNFCAKKKRSVWFLYCPFANSRSYTGVFENY